MRLPASLLILPALFILSGCDWGKKDKGDDLPANNAEDMVVNEANVTEARASLPEVSNASNVTNAVVVPPPPKPSEEQQTQEDAEAAGMTSRLPNGEMLANAAQ